MEFSTSKIKLAGLLIVAFLLLGACYFFTTLPSIKAQIAGWAGLAFFGFGVLVIVWQLFKPNSGPTVTIDDQGIFDRRLKIGAVPWNTIQSVWVGAVHSQKFLCIETADPTLVPSKLAAAGNRHLGFPAITVGFVGLSQGIKDAWAFIKKNYPQKAVEKGA
jgi:hypothetical protein